jgi:hypothetical protein
MHKPAHLALFTKGGTPLSVQRFSWLFSLYQSARPKQLPVRVILFLPGAFLNGLDSHCPTPSVILSP